MRREQVLAVAAVAVERGRMRVIFEVSAVEDGEGEGEDGGGGGSSGGSRKNMRMDERGMGKEGLWKEEDGMVRKT